jgi:hypothetical protein
VRVPRLAQPTDSIWALWGNPAASTVPYGTRGAPWPEGYAAVWHLNEDVEDSTTNRVASSNAYCVAAEGCVAGGRRFSGGGDYIGPALDGAWYGERMNITLWLRPDASACGAAFGAYDFRKPFGIASGGGKWIFTLQNQTSTNAVHGVEPGRWQQLTWVLDGGAAIAYMDGVRSEGPAYTGFSPGRSPWIGNLNGQTGTGSTFVGLMDEVRIETAVRSDAWVWASYLTTRTATDCPTSGRGGTLAV